MAKESTTVLSRTEGVDARQLRALTRSLRGFKPDKELHKALRVAGQLIADDAKVLLDGHSKSVPPTIKVRVSKTKLTVVAGGADVPLAGLLELGNKGKGRKRQQAADESGVFRHPLFGNKEKWIEQPMHPYLLKAAVKNSKNIERLEGVAVAKAFAEQDLPMSG